MNRAFGRDGGGGDDRPPPIPGGILIMAGIVAVIAYGALKSGNLSKETFIYFAGLVPCIILHEISHGWLANMFGDPTAKRAGRLTLNPLRHVDAVGTFILPAIMLLTTHSAFGYAKPVPVNTSRMSRNRAMMVALIGPLTNIAIVVVVTIILNIVYSHHAFMSDSVAIWTLKTCLLVGRANVVLAVFNLIPIPPLDGSSIVERFLPSKYMYQYLQFRKYAMILLLVLVLGFGQFFNALFDPALRFWINTFTPYTLP